jgi:hypothetical protein
MNRRDFLHLTGIVASAAVLAGCQPVYRQLGGPVESGQNSVFAPLLPARAQAALGGMTFGPRQQERAWVLENGLAAWIEEQLAPLEIDDQPLAVRLRPFGILEQSPDDLYVRGEKLFDSVDPAPIIAEMQAVSILRQVYSRRQLYETMVEFWSDHFNISMDKENVWYLKPIDDRQVIRPHALGNFHQMLQASAHSPAMLTYLDNQANQAGSPNENYARELMELHTMGVDGGYTQNDVMEMARCLTGWTVKEKWWRGEFTFNPDFHDQGTKTVLGLSIHPGGMAEAEGVLDHLADHPATARFLAAKLARRFIAEDPPEHIVERAAQAFRRSDGEIAPMLRVILLDGLLSPEYNPPPQFKRPVDFVVSALRALNAETDGGSFIQRTLAQLGQPPFRWPTPDGPPQANIHWMGNLLPRWKYALALGREEIEGTGFDLPALLGDAGDIPGFLDRLAGRLTGARLPAEKTSRLIGALRSAGASDDLETARVVASGMMASPAFQWK